MRGRALIMICLLAALLSIPAFVSAEDGTTVAVVVDDSGCFVSGAKAGQVDPQIYCGTPGVAVQATISKSFDFASLNTVFMFILSESFKRFVITFCGILVGIGGILLSREHVTNVF